MNNYLEKLYVMSFILTRGSKPDLPNRVPVHGKTKREL
jgi:hypothetical protein